MSVLRGGISNRQRLVKSMGEIAQVKNRKGTITANSYFQQRAISADSLEEIFGTQQDFLGRYAKFEKDYHLALSNKLNHAKGLKVNAQLMEKQGKIDLTVLNRDVADRLYKQYRDDVLRMGHLIQKEGLPSAEMPSSNLYRKAYKFEVNQLRSTKTGELHPMQILLNRMMLNFNPDAKGLDALNVGRQSILSHGTVKDLFENANVNGPSKIFGSAPTQGKKLKILTFDVETTGVTEFSNVRSMSMAEMTMDHTGKISMPETLRDPITKLKDFQYAFKSPQTAGLRVTTMNDGVRPLSEFLAKAEGIPLSEMGEGGKNYLDATERFFNKLLEADRVAGHNINFDIDKMIDTAIKQEGFAQHTGINKAFTEFAKRRAQGNYVIDTLEATRSHLQGQVQELVDAGKYADISERSKAFVNNLFSHEILARTHIGGSASYGSVENIALNTNLFELIEKDGQANNLFDLITKGSHIAETDVHLQSHIARYVQNGELKIQAMAEHEASSLTTQQAMAKGLKKSEFGTFARSKILQSSAITPTTNIASVEHMSQNVFNYLTTAEGKKGISLSLSAEDINQRVGANVISATDMTKKGILEYTKGDNGMGYHFITGEGKQLVDETHAGNVIDQILKSARSRTNLGDLVVGGVKHTGVRNLAAEAIVDTSISIQRASKADELIHISRSMQAVNANSMTAKDLTETFGTTYREFGTGLSYGDQMRLARGKAPIQSVFQSGLNDYSLKQASDVANAFAKVGDPYAHILSMDDRAYSTIMANATAKIGHEANRAGAAAGYTAEHIAHSAKSNLTAELGMTFFHSQKEVKLLNALDSTTEIPKMMLPPEILQEAFSRTQASLGKTETTIAHTGLSIARRQEGDTVNAVWLADRQMVHDETKIFSGHLLDIMGDKNEVSRITGVKEADFNASITEAINNVNAAKNTSQGLTPHIESMTEGIMDKGIIFGHAGDASAEIISSLEQSGTPISNDVLLNIRTGSIATTGHTSDVVVINNYMDRKAVDIAGKTKDLEKAEEVIVDKSGAKLSRSVKNANEIAEIMGSDKSTNLAITKNIRRGKSGLEINKMAEFYASHKAKLGYGALGVGVAAAGYYMYKKHRERQLYNETLDRQPTERAITTDQMEDSSRAFSQVSSFRKDPLATAGVVGNLDRAKIGHTQMGPNKYNHLFGG